MLTTDQHKNEKKYRLQSEFSAHIQKHLQLFPANVARVKPLYTSTQISPQYLCTADALLTITRWRRSMVREDKFSFKLFYVFNLIFIDLPLRMVLQDSLLMSKGSLAEQAPKPPSFEEILSDLKRSSSEDVAFQHPTEVCPAVKALRGHSLPLHGDKEHISKFC